MLECPPCTCVGWGFSAQNREPYPLVAQAKILRVGHSLLQYAFRCEVKGLRYTARLVDPIHSALPVSVLIQC
eukprot:scaffold4314_cov388-Prasinococcus_capsulatus_cf.AAC.2